MFNEKMSKEEIKETTLINLRSVIQSRKGGIPLKDLQNDYKSLIGKPIPFDSLGYQSLEEFIKSIPNVIKLRKTCNGALFAEAVPDASTSHLANLISKQKGPGSKKAKSPPFSKKSNTFSRNQVSNSQELDLKLELEKEREKNSKLLSELSHLHSIVQQKQAEKNALNIELRNSKLSMSKEIADLEKKLSIEENKNKLLSNQIAELNLSMWIKQENLLSEQKKVQQLLFQLEELQKKMVLKYSTLNGVKWKENLDMEKKNEVLGWDDNLSETNSQKSYVSSKVSDQQPSKAQFDFMNLYKEQSIQVNDLKNQVKQHRENMTVLRTCLKQQQLQINHLTTQIKKLPCEPPKTEVDMGLLVQMLLKHLQDSTQNKGIIAYLGLEALRHAKTMEDLNCNKISQPVKDVSGVSCEAAVKASSQITSVVPKRKTRRKKNKGKQSATVTAAVRDRA